jgi:polyphosphate glucokinase
MKVLVVDVGGTHIKVLATGQPVERKADSGPTMRPDEMVAIVKGLTADWEYEVVSLGYPGPGWVGFDYAAAFGRPVKIANDAAMQALGSYEGGRMLFLGLGTGLGSAMVVNGSVAPMELAHLPYKKHRDFEQYVGLVGLKRLGKKKWRREVALVIAELSAALEPDYVVLGGGNAKLVRELPPNVRLGANTNAFAGGFRLWEEEAKPRAARRRPLRSTGQVST